MSRSRFQLKQGILQQVDIIEQKPIILGKAHGFRITISHDTTIEKFIIVANGQYMMEIRYGYGIDDRDKEKVEKSIQSLYFSGESGVVNTVHDFRHTDPTFHITMTPPWTARSFDSVENPLGIIYHASPDVVTEFTIQQQTITYY